MTSIQSRIHALEALSGSSQILENDWVAAPPLPPRQPSSPASLVSVASENISKNGENHTYPPDSSVTRPNMKQRVGSSSSSLSSRSRSSTVSSTSARNTHKSMGPTLTTPTVSSHAASSSISSMQSVSLEHSDADDESFESVSAQLSSFEQVSPIRERHEFFSANGGKPIPPKLPERKSTTAIVTSATSSTGRKPPPPPPPMRTTPSPAASISSFTSYASSVSFSKPSSVSTLSASKPASKPPPPPIKAKPSLTNVRLSRPTPVPPAARARYVSLFDANLALAQAAATQKTKPPPPPPRPDNKPTTPPRKTDNQLSPPRSRQGWRGISVDLTTTSPTSASFPTSPSSPTSPGDERDTDKLHPEVVKRLWELSRLPKARLREIWEECILGTGAKDKGKGVGRDEFVAGMWRIDEELRRRSLGGGRGSLRRR